MQASQNTRCFVPFIQDREYVSMTTLVCACGTIILINREPSELVGHAGASGSKINNDGVLMLKQACSLVAEGSNTHRIKALFFLTLFSIALEINGLEQYRVVIQGHRQDFQSGGAL